jgi:hypothetical protein
MKKEQKINAVRIFSTNHSTTPPVTYQFVEAKNKYQTYTYRTDKDWKIYINLFSNET